MAVTRIAASNLSVEVENGRIRAVGPGDAGSGLWLAPGFVDLQVNGYAGHDLNGEHLTPRTVLDLVRALRATGTTTLLPTLITAPEERMLRAMRAIAEACEAFPEVGHAVAGLHVEGPHISPVDGPRGAHPLADVRPPDLALFGRWQEASGGRVRMVTLSPHWPDTAAYVAALAREGIRVAIGHTDASPADVLSAVDAGATFSTHLGNGIAATLPRHPNILWTQLAEDRLTATFIADGHHLPADTLKAMARAKGAGRCVAVSDVTALGGLPPGVYRQPIGGEVELTADGRLGVRGTPYLAGAARTLFDALPLLVRLFGPDEAIAMVSGNPARAAGLKAGTLDPGMPADFVLLSGMGGAGPPRLEAVVVAGQGVDLATGRLAGDAS
ncbi:N-acetylglucosamine-6-phosphate deacetylase [Alsobacter sp. R-9]